MSIKRRRVIIYVRISRTTDESISLERQERTLCDLCALEGWDVVEVIRDDGQSGTKDRTNAQRALQMLRDGTADTLLVWKFDRWSRQGLPAVADLIDVVGESKGRVLFYAKDDGIRSDNSAWRMLAIVLAEVAAMEAENTAARIVAARAEHLSKTRPEDQRFLGGKAPFGYQSVPNPHGAGRALAIDEYEATIVRDVAARLIDGEKLTDITVWLDAQAVPTPQSPARLARQAGKPTDGLDRGAWRVTTVRNLWISETLIGRTTKREPILNDDGTPALDANHKPRMVRRVVSDAMGIPITRWAPILDGATFERLQRRLPSHGRTQPRRMASWLSDVARCGGCGGKLYVQAHKRANDTRSAFRCAAGGNPLDPCPAPATVDVRRLEEFAEAQFLAFGGGLPVLKREERIVSPDTVRDLQDVGQALADTTAAMGRDGADYVALLARLDALKAQRRDLQSRPSAVEVVMIPTGRTLAEDWADLGDSLPARRDLFRDVIRRVSVTRADTTIHLGGPIEDRVAIDWDPDRVPEIPGRTGESRGPGHGPVKRPRRDRASTPA